MLWGWGRALSRTDSQERKARKASWRRAPLCGPPWYLGDLVTVNRAPLLQFLYLTALTVGIFVSGGPGAEVRKSRCVSLKPTGLHNSSQTQKQKLCFFGKRRTSPFNVFVACPRLSTGHLGFPPQIAAANSAHPCSTNAYGLGGAAPHPPPPHPAPQVGVLSSHLLSLEGLKHLARFLRVVAFPFFVSPRDITTEEEGGP